MKPPSRKFVLTSGLKVDYAPFDDLHAELMDRLAALEARRAEPGGVAPSEDVRAFVQAFVAHMDAEIAILKDLGYEDIDSHVAGHRRLEQEILHGLSGQSDDEIIAHLAWCLLEDAIKEDLAAKEFLRARHP